MHTPPEMVGLAVFVSALLAIAYIDIRQRRVPDALTLGTFAVLLVITIITDMPSTLWFLASAALGFLSIWAVRYFSGGKIGMGDVKLSGLMSAALGPVGWFFALFIASITGLVGSLIMISAGRMSRSDAVPFAPFLAAGSICFILINLACGVPKWIEI